jgi:hypothetical protein
MFMEAICSSETWVLTKATRCHIPEDGIPQGHRSENFRRHNLTAHHYFKARHKTEPPMGKDSEQPYKGDRREQLHFLPFEWLTLDV